MEVHFVDYAREQLRERGLSEEDAAQVVRDPEQVIEGKSPRRIARSKIRLDDKEYLLRVIFEQVGDIATVITAYRTSKIDKYWRT